VSLRIGIATSLIVFATSSVHADTYTLPTGQLISPVGTVRSLKLVGRPRDMAVSPEKNKVAILGTGGVAIFTSSGEPRATKSFAAGVKGIAWAPNGKSIFAADSVGAILHLDATTLAQLGRRVIVNAPDHVTALGTSPISDTLYVALGRSNQVLIVSLATWRIEDAIPVGIAPFALNVSADGARIVVLNRGGQPPREGDAFGTTAGSLVAVDPKTGTPRTGSITVIGLRPSEQRRITIEVPAQPAGVAIAPTGELFVASSDSDVVTRYTSSASARTRAVDRNTLVRPLRTISISPDGVTGQLPTAVALSDDGRLLFVACGGSNAIAVISLLEASPTIRYIPTAWFPMALAYSDGTLIVACAKGLGAQLDSPGRARDVFSITGGLEFIKPADWQPLEKLTERVASLNAWRVELPPRDGVLPRPIPERVGEPSVFRHVVFVIKENLTYDAVLGDLDFGEGDPSLTLFGSEVSPNHHSLASEYVLMDNVYTTGTNSADGHYWTTSAIANSYVEQNFGSKVRTYPFDGDDALAASPGGYLWSRAAAHGLSVRIYGEFVNAPLISPPPGTPISWRALWDDYISGANRFVIKADTNNVSVKPFLHPRYIGFPTTVSDQWRASEFLKDLQVFEETGDLPRLIVMLLPNDHTTGTAPGFPTPRAAVADNDLALGRIIEALTKSKFWRETLILVIEDDSQLGLDHVNGHRTIAFAVSPYTKRRSVDSTLYTHLSFVRTAALVLGLPAPHRLERAAVPLRASFTVDADYTPYIARRNRVALTELNPPLSQLSGEALDLARACERLDWSDVDRADAPTVARAVWKSVRSEEFPGDLEIAQSRPVGDAICGPDPD
jgi:DNA-binding beta-propeller fold protein YncE